MTEAEAQDLIRQLEEHYGEPVQPVSAYCHAFKTWADTVAHLIPAVRGIEISVTKSNLLARLIYGKERLRTTPCPEHKGHWSGLFIECECQGTGWLPNKPLSLDTIEDTLKQLHVSPRMARMVFNSSGSFDRSRCDYASRELLAVWDAGTTEQKAQALKDLESLISKDRNGP